MVDLVTVRDTTECLPKDVIYKLRPKGFIGAEVKEELVGGEFSSLFQILMACLALSSY